ncbi:MAG: MmgE/PrpD family protein [Bacillota bacterium]
MTAHAPQHPVTRDLAAFCEGITWESLPSAVQAHIKLCILDTLGCALHGSTVPWGRTLLEFAAGGDGGSGAEATLIGDGRKVPAHAAALANGTLSHSFEMDDLHKQGVIHPGSNVIPAVLALAERMGGVSGKEFLAAVAAGYEAGCRVGAATGAIQLKKGFHPSATSGAVAAGAGAARVARLTGETYLHAVGIAGTQASGLMAAQYNSYVKRMHSGRSAESGVYGALLARRGLTGIQDLLEAPYGGFCTTMAEGSDPMRVIQDLGTVWEILAVGFKPYSCCGSNHTTIDALEQLQAELPGLNGETVEQVTVQCTRTSLLHVGWPYKPESITSAQMNLPYAAAVQLQDGQAFVDQYTAERIRRPDTVALAGRIRVVETDEFNHLGSAGRHGVRVSVRLKDGRRGERVVIHAKGSSHFPLRPEQVRAKFTQLAGKVLDTGQVLALEQAVLRLEEISDISALAELLHPQAR